MCRERRYTYADFRLSYFAPHLVRLPGARPAPFVARLSRAGSLTQCVVLRPCIFMYSTSVPCVSAATAVALCWLTLRYEDLLLRRLPGLDDV